MIRTPYRYNTLTRWTITVPAIPATLCVSGWLGGAYQLTGLLAALPICALIGFLLGRLWRRR